MICIQFAFSSQVCEQFSTGYVVHEEIQVPAVLCEPFQSNLLLLATIYLRGMDGQYQLG